MRAVHPAGTEPDKPRPYPQAGLQALAERALRSGPYRALQTLSCDCQGGVLVLRGCLPTYYLKQVAQEVVAHQVQGLARLDNQIQVVRLVVREPPADPAKPGVLDTDESFDGSRREPSPDSNWRTERRMTLIAPYGEEIEIHG
jgi:hypothetical protein